MRPALPEVLIASSNIVTSFGQQTTNSSTSGSATASRIRFASLSTRGGPSARLSAAAQPADPPARAGNGVPVADPLASFARMALEGVTYRPLTGAPASDLLAIRRADDDSLLVQAFIGQPRACRARAILPPGTRPEPGTGRCLCGAVPREVRGPLHDVLRCHCEECRRLTRPRIGFGGEKDRPHPARAARAALDPESAQRRRCPAGVLRRVRVEPVLGSPRAGDDQHRCRHARLGRRLADRQPLVCLPGWRVLRAAR